jgi:hypothetical protein
MKTKKAVGTRKNPQEMTVRRQKSRVEDELLPQAGCRTHNKLPIILIVTSVIPK